MEIRKFITLILCFPSLVWGQSFSISGPTTVYGPTYATISQGYSITNNTNDTLYLLCKKEIIDTTATTINYFCLGDDCYGETVYTAWSSERFLPNETKNNVFIGYYFANNIPSIAIIKYYFYPYNSVNDTTTITVTYNTLTSSLSEENNRSLTVYPNPTEKEINLSEVADVLVYDMFGKMLIRKENVQHLDISFLSNGVYIVEINGIRKRIIKQ